MRAGQMSAWMSAMMLASGGPMPGVGPWPLTMGAWVFYRTNDGDEEELGR